MSAERVVAVIGPGAKVLGGDRWRMVLPFQALQIRGYDAWVSRPQDLGQFQNGKLIDAAVFHQAGVSSDSAIQMIAKTMRDSGCRMVYDLDDRMDHLDRDNLLGASNPPFRWNARFLEVCDLVTVTTSHLAEWVHRYTDAPVAVIPNRVTNGLFCRIEHDRLTVGLGGSPSHSHDWNSIRPALNRLIERFPEVRFLCYGADLGFSGANVEARPWQGWDDYRRTVGEVDIGLCPLTDSIFNRGKSPLKWIEFGSIGIPCVVSPTVYGHVVDDGVDGLIAESQARWEEAISELIRNPFLRARIGELARRSVHHRWTETDETLTDRWRLYTVGSEKWKSERSSVAQYSSPVLLRSSR